VAPRSGTTVAGTTPPGPSHQAPVLTRCVWGPTGVLDTTTRHQAAPRQAPVAGTDAVCGDLPPHQVPGTSTDAVCGDLPPHQVPVTGTDAVCGDLLVPWTRASADQWRYVAERA